MILNPYKLLENESKYGQLSQKVRQLRGELNDVDDLVDQAEEYLTELNQKYDFELEKKSNNGKSPETKKTSKSSLNSSKASKSSSRNQV